MSLPTHPLPDQMASRRPVPHDIKNAIAYLRAAACRPTSMKHLAAHCGVAERTLTAHFRSFVGVPPMDYLRRLRLAAAREALLAGGLDLSVTDVAKLYRFNHFGRFADLYRRCFGEPPSATLRHARVAAREREATEYESAGAEPRPSLRSRERPSLAVLPC